MTYDPEEDMRKRRAAQIWLEARALLDEELWDAEVQRQVARLRAESNKSLWQRLLDKLPFTITWKNR